VSTCFTKYLQKCDTDLLEAVTEVNIVIWRLTDEKNDVHVWEVLLDKACEIASEFEIEASRHRVVVRQRNIVYYVYLAYHLQEPT
jgi:hypothetical protein